MARRLSKQPDRLTATLVILVGSMTIGAGVLNWIHGLTRPSAAPAKMLTARVAPPAWSKIVIHSTTRSGETTPFHHFFIAEDGSESFSLAWQRLQQDASSSRAIHLLLEQPRDGSGTSRRQWESLFSRIRVLQARYGISARNVTIDASNAAGDAGLTRELSRLQRMLRTAGLVG